MMENKVRIELRIRLMGDRRQEPVHRVQIHVNVSNGQLDIDEIYDHLNRFIEQQSIKDPMVMYKDCYDKRHILRKDSELDVKSHETVSSWYFIDLIIESGGQMTELQSQIEQLSVEKDNITKKITQCQETVLERLGERTGQETDIGFLYAEPIRKDFDKIHNNTPVTYEIEIQCIKNLLNEREKKFTLKSKVATLQNCQELLEKGVTILHISSHGSKVDEKKLDSEIELELESSTELGFLQRFSSGTFEQIFHNVFDLNLQSPKTKPKPSIIILNACYSGNLAKKIRQKLDIPYTIGINHKYKIKDLASEKFTSRFYAEILNNTSVEKSFSEAVSYVRREMNPSNPSTPFKLLCCCETHGKSDIHSPTCTYKKECFCKKINKDDLMKCTCTNKIYCSHAQGCEFLQIVRVMGYPIHRKEEDMEYLICCCNEIHDESKKFNLYKSQQEKKIEFKSEKVDVVLSPEEDYFPLEQRIKYQFYKQNQVFWNCLQALLVKSNKICLLIGQSGCGKTTYARKLVYYILERQNVFELIVINCRNFESILDIYLNFRLKREGKWMNMDQVIKYLKERTEMTAFIVYDHCDRLLQSSNRQMMSLIQMLSLGLPNTKILIIANESNATNEMKMRYKGINMEQDSFKQFLETRYSVRNLSIKNQKGFKLIKFKNLMKETEDPENSTFDKLKENIAKKQIEEEKLHLEYENILLELERPGFEDLLKSVVVLSVFRAGIKADEESVLNKFVMDIDSIRQVEMLRKILDESHAMARIKFVESWLQFILSKDALLRRYFGVICQTFWDYMNHYIVARIKKQPNFFLQEFQISPFQTLPKATDYPHAQKIEGEIVLTSQNIRSLLSMTVMTEDDNTQKMYRNILINIPILMQLLYQEKISSYIHKCLNRMSLIQKNILQYKKGEMRLYFQLNRFLITSEANFEESLEIINRNLQEDANISASIIDMERSALMVEKSVLLLQEKHYILQKTHDYNLSEQLKSHIFTEISKINELFDKIQSSRCKSRICCFIGALVVQLIDKYKNVDIIVNSLNNNSHLNLNTLIDEARKYGQSDEVAYFQRKAKAIYFSLEFYRLEFKQKNDIKMYQNIIDQINQYLDGLPKNPQNSEYNFEDWHLIIRRITDYISKKKESLITILTSKPLGSLIGSEFTSNRNNLYRFEDRVADTLSSELKNFSKMIMIRTNVLNEKNLKEVLDEGCLLQMLIVDLYIRSDNLYIIFEEKDRLQKHMSLDEFQKKFDFKNVSILILSGLNTTKLKKELKKIYPNLFIVGIEKNKDTKKARDPLYWDYDQMFIWNLCNRYFLSYFCKVLVGQSPADPLIDRYCYAADIARHRINIKLLESCHVINKESDIDQYIVIDKYQEHWPETFHFYNESDSEGEEYLTFTEGNVITFFQSSETCQNLEPNITNFGLNEPIHKVLQLLKQNIEIINVYGPMPFLDTMAYQIYKTLLRNGQKTVIYIPSSLSDIKKNAFLNAITSKKYIIFSHKINMMNRNEIMNILEKFEQMCNGTGRKVILLTDSQARETEYTSERSYRADGNGRIKYETVHVSEQNINCWAYMALRKAFKECDIKELEKDVGEKSRLCKDDPERLIQELSGKVRPIGSEFKRTHSNGSSR